MKEDNKKNRRIKFIANRLQKDILVLVFLAAFVPMIVVSIVLFYLIFNITAQQMVIPENIAYNLIPAAKIVTNILLFAAPISVVVIVFLSYKITHRIVGPFDRILKELDECIDGKKRDLIVLRTNDKFQPLVDRINKLLSQMKPELTE